MPINTNNPVLSFESKNLSIGDRAVLSNEVRKLVFEPDKMRCDELVKKFPQYHFEITATIERDGNENIWKKKVAIKEKDPTTEKGFVSSY